MTSPLKCVIWDLDDTLWRGTLAEGDDVRAVPAALTLVRRLEEAGVVQSIASGNDPDEAGRVLTTLGLSDVFVYPQISWSAKSASVGRIIRLLDIGADTVAFLDDSPFERAEVQAGMPGVRCYSVPEFLALDAACQLVPSVVTPDAAKRPQAYRQESRRRAAGSAFEGTPVEFLTSLDLVLAIRTAGVDDLDRAAELTRRTNQLNTTGRTFSVEELTSYLEDPTRRVLVAELVDRFGDYGSIGLCLLELFETSWLIEQLLMSCRVRGRNIGNAFIAAVAGLADAQGVSLQALYLPNGRNRQMRITYAFLGFAPVDAGDGIIVFEHPAPGQIRVPPYIKVTLPPVRWSDP